MNQETAEWFRLEFVILHRRLDELAEQISRIQPQPSTDESASPSKMVPSPLRLTRPSAPPPPAHVVKLSSLSNGSPLLRPDGKPRGPRGARGEREIRFADQRMTLKSPSLSSRQEMETETNAAIPTTATVPVELWQRTHPAFRTPSRQRSLRRQSRRDITNFGRRSRRRARKKRSQSLRVQSCHHVCRTCALVCLERRSHEKTSSFCRHTWSCVGAALCRKARGVPLPIIPHH